MMAELEMKRKAVEQFALTDPERFWHYLHHLFPKNPFLVCALDMAGWDIWGKLKQVPLYKLWGLDATKMPYTDYTIGIAAADEMLQKINELPWPVYKIKMGFQDDLKLIERLRLHTDKPFRVDVNAGWQVDEAIEKIEALQQLQIELIEQPIAKYDWENSAALKKQSNLPIFADESCVFEKDVQSCVVGFHGINIKLTKCSGITPARRMIKDAHSKGLKVMLGCMNENIIGTAALLHLSPMVEKLDADGPLLLNDLSNQSLQPVNGFYAMPEMPGLGIDIQFDQI